MTRKELLKRIVSCAVMALIVLIVVGVVPITLGYIYGYIADHTLWQNQVIATNTNHGSIFVGDLFRWSGISFSVVVVFITGSELVNYGMRGGCDRA